MKTAVCLCAALLCAAPVHASQMPPERAASGLGFAYDDTATDTTVDLIRHARRRVLLAGYEALQPAVASALHAARVRGVDVRVVLYRANEAERYRGVGYLTSGGIDVAIDTRRADPAPRFVIADESVALAAPAQGTPPNGATLSVFRRAPEVAQSYAQAFWRLYRQASGL